jgi:hypothetical protein
MTIFLNTQEIAELDRVDRRSGSLHLGARDLERFARYAFDYRRGGWQGRLQRIFGRTLGPGLGRREWRPAA